MDTNQVVQLLGGRKRVMEITGLTKGRISQWITENHIPSPWLVAFEAMHPEFNWAYLRKAERDEEAA